MKIDIIINSTTSETRIAMLEENQLVELFVERPEHERMVGSIYKGIVRKVLPGISAAFIDIGMSQDAFLHFSDIGGGNELIDRMSGDGIDAEEENNGGNRRKWDSSNLKIGQQILVQVIKEPIGQKGPRVSSQISVPGRFIVIVPNENFIGVSRKITNFKEKRRLRSILSKNRVKGFGVIARTQAETKSEQGLIADLDRAMKTWNRIERNVKRLKGPGLVYRDMTMASSIIRDLFTPEVNSLVVDSGKLYRTIKDYVDDVAPSLSGKVHQYKERTPIFDKHEIETEIEKSLSRKIWLSGGGYVYIDPTEALVSIDVNSGRFVGKKDHEENALKVNLKAAREICRQLRLRDIGGIIVIDYIDMNEEKNRQKVLEEMRKALRMDRAKWDMAPIGPFGLMEMTRQRNRPSLLFTLREPCPNCNGTGLVPSMETVVTNIERWIKRFKSKTRERRLQIIVSPKVKKYLTGGLQSRIAHIMWMNRIFITLSVDETLRIDEFKCFSYKKNADVTDEYRVGVS